MLITHIRDAFTKIFTSTSPQTGTLFPLVRYYLQYNPFIEHHQWLSSTPLPEEIYRNFFSIPPLKALGLDGYHVIFFQKNWHILGSGIIQVIQEIFETTTIPEDWGATNLILIPKINRPNMITQFRPISLCNTLYKLVSRIILQRLKPYITNIINPCQASFVPSRCTSDNIIIVQEIIHTMVRKSRPKGHVALKLDLEKAYDHLEWSFIKETLEFFQIPHKLINLIMNMISSTCINIMWNGTPLSTIIPSRGIYQGDPISLYLFILCLERLSILQEEAVQDKTIHPVTFRGKIKISHLFFADDIFLFLKAKIIECQNLKNILQIFCKCFGQIICTQKSRLWFSPNTSRRTKELIASIFDIPTTTQLRIYLETPIFTTHQKASAYQYIVDNI